MNCTWVESLHWEIFPIGVYRDVTDHSTFCFPNFLSRDSLLNWFFHMKKTGRKDKILLYETHLTHAHMRICIA